MSLAAASIIGTTVAEENCWYAQPPIDFGGSGNAEKAKVSMASEWVGL
jgi:hypothetical protein